MNEDSRNSKVVGLINNLKAKTTQTVRLEHLVRELEKSSKPDIIRAVAMSCLEGESNIVNLTDCLSDVKNHTVTFDAQLEEKLGV